MEYVVIVIVALCVSMLTLFSGFGLGTLLMPALAIFFPVPVAIAATAIVHLANNIFKVGLLGSTDGSASRSGNYIIHRYNWILTSQISDVQSF